MFIRVLSLFLIVSCTKKVDFDSLTLNLVVPAEVKGFDPIQASDLYSSNEIARVYEGLYQYHYLKRPFELIPNLAESMPIVSKDGLSYTVKLKKGVLFHDDECFPSSIGRELKASDVIYSIKRLADTKTMSVGWWILDGKIKGLNEWREKYSKENATQYNDRIEGLEEIDDYTVKFTLTHPFPQFMYALAMPYTFVVPHEAVTKYGKEFLNHPVGTGAFRTSKFSQSNKIVYTKNEKYREEYYPSEGEEGDAEKGLLDDKGKKLPLVDSIVVNIQTEDQPRWLAFEKGKLDYVSVPKDNFSQVMTPSKEISASYKEKEIDLLISPDLDVTYIAFNFDNEFLRKNISVRKAMSLAYDHVKANDLFYNGTGIFAQGIIPPGISGYDEKLVNPYKRTDLKEAKNLLEKAGFKDGKGIPVITYDTLADTVSRQMGELLRTEMAKIGITIDVRTNTWPELTKKVDNRQTMMFGMAWGADYPDAENFLSLLYGPNASPGSNGANYNNEEYNKIFDRAKVMQPTKEREELYKKLNKMAIQDVPWIFGVHRTKFTVRHSWLKNYKFTPFDQGIEKYLTIDREKKKEMFKKL